jgi:hypothetical protein
MKKLILSISFVALSFIVNAQISANQQIGGSCMSNRKVGDTTLVTRRVMVINHPAINPTNYMPIGTPNILDLRNDGVTGFIEYGNTSANSVISLSLGGTPSPPKPPLTLKINSTCGANTEIGYGGGYVSTGRNFEVGFPTRNNNITSNIFSQGALRIGQRITTNHIATQALGPQYNTQLFVNRNFSHALSVFNNLTNASGDEKFIVYGDGKTQINSLVKTDKYFVVNDVSNPSSQNESFAIYGNGKTELRINTNTGTDNVFNIFNVVDNKYNFRIKANGFVYGREIVVQTNPFPDYVFNKDYKLTPLSEVENYIITNKHLKGFSKGSDYEMNGMPIGEIVRLQQEKIEELTLYLIEIKKELESLKNK